MKINLTLESGLEVDFTPDFKVSNEALTDQAIWMLPDPRTTTQNTLLLDPEYLISDQEDLEESQKE